MGDEDDETATHSVQRSLDGSESENILMSIPYLRLTIIGNIRNWKSLTMAEIFLCFTTVVALLSFSAYSLWSYALGDSLELVVFLCSFVNAVFILFYLVHGILLEEPFELFSLGLSVILVAVLFFCSFFTDVPHALEKQLGLNILAAAALACTILTFCTAFCLSHKYYKGGHLVFKIVGGFVKTQKMCQRLLMAQSLLAFDGQFSSTLLCFILVPGRGFDMNTTDEEVYLCIAFLLFAIRLFVGYFAMRLESGWLTGLFWGMSLFRILYIVRLFHEALVKILRCKCNLVNLSMILATIICVLSDIFLIYISRRVYLNYGKGLSARVYGRKDEEKKGNEQRPLLRPGSPNSKQNYQAFALEPAEADNDDGENIQFPQFSHSL